MHVLQMLFAENGSYDAFRQCRWGQKPHVLFINNSLLM